MVDEARLRTPARELARMAREAAGKFIWAIAGNLPGFEEVSRALYAKDTSRLDLLTQPWPKDIRTHFLQLAQQADELEKQGH